MFFKYRPLKYSTGANWASIVFQMENCRERDAISSLLNISRLGNQLMQAEKPWKLVKSESTADKVSNRKWQVFRIQLI
jgi:methionyl-tRNA synthetase